MNKILMIEDNEEILEEVLTWLSLEGYEAMGATNGQQGIDLALQQRPDLILSDIMMPEKDGHRVLLELRTHAATALTPFIFTTAKQAKVDVRYGMELGADDYITKPFGREELLNAVQSRLARAQLILQQHDQRVHEARNSLLYRLPHELRTPLVGILGVGELLSQDADSLTPADIAEYAGLITSSGQQLYRLVENHLLYAQLELHATTPAQAALSNPDRVAPAAPVIQESSALVAAHYGREATMATDLQLGMVQMTREDLAKVIHELVDNACKFSAPTTMIELVGRVVQQHYQVTVTDQGRGIAPADLARVGAFVQFERANYEQPGSGLGLAIAQRLVELAGGALALMSTPAVGTVVTVTLPLRG
jgi:signal transduction histidine kinase